MDIWGNLGSFDTFGVDWVHFSRFWYHAPRKIWQPWLGLCTEAAFFGGATFKQRGCVNSGKLRDS
jgi:hypothetical protein